MELEPTFDKGVVEYATISPNANEIVTAVAEDEDSTVSIACGEVTGESGDSFNLEVGENEIVITVTNGEDEKVYTVVVTRVEEADCTLSALTIGNLGLTPAFDKDVDEYIVSTTNATNTITATPTDEDATVSIVNGETPVESGSPASWVEGENIVTVTVTNGDDEKVYTVTVTHSTSVEE